MIARSSRLLSLARIAIFLPLTLLLLPFQFLAVGLRARAVALFIPLAYHRVVLRLFGFRVAVRGTISRSTPTLFISNHISYFDIEILGSLIPGCFVAKNEVKGWPLFGWLAVAQRSVFIDRRLGSMRDQLAAIGQRLDAGDNLILFPEGTTGDGNRLLPFRSSLFAVAEARPGQRPPTVQPVTIAYSGLNGLPIGRELRPLFAWYGSMTMMSHLWHLLGLGTTDLVVEFHQPLTIERAGSRKALSAHCERVIVEAYARANAGRIDAEAPAALPATPIRETQRAVGMA